MPQAHSVPVAPATPAKSPVPARRSAILVQWGKYSFTREFLSEDTTGTAHHALEIAHMGSAGEPMCMCQPRGVAMHVQRRNGHYNLKRNPNTGHLHSPHCDSFGGIPEAALDIYDTGVLEQIKNDGPVKLRLSMPLTTIVDEPADLPMHQASHAAQTARHKKCAMTLRGYMNFLWESAALHEYDPNYDLRRNYKTVSERLEQISQDHVILGGTQRMSDRLFLPDAPPPLAYQKSEQGVAAKIAHATAQTEELNKKFDHATTLCQPNEAPIVLVLGELLSTYWMPEKQGSSQLQECRITLKSSGRHHQVRDYLGVVVKIANSSPGIVANTLLQPGQPQGGVPAHRIWLLLGVQMHVTKKSDRFLKLVYGACLLCTDKSIPVESGYELQVGNALQHQARHFKKPLRYESDKDARPDFVLLDTQPPVDMEVFGFTGDVYEARARQKIEGAKNIGKRLWWWNPNESSQIPAFPPAAPPLSPP